MAAKSLPATENTADDFRNWIIKDSMDEHVGHLLVPEADQDYSQYDMCIAPHVPAESAWCGIVDNGVSSGDEFTMHVARGMQIDTKAIATGASFSTFGQHVWYDPINKVYTDTEDSGLWLVGYVVIPVNSQGVMRFEKRRYALPGEAS